MISKGPFPLPDRIEAVRRFGHFYGQRIREAYRAAAVNELTATELRVFAVLGEADDGRAGAWLNDRLRIDPGHLSRILRKFQDYGFVRQRASHQDARLREFALTDWGWRAERQQRRLVHAMKVIEAVLIRAPLLSLLEKCGVPIPRARS